MDTRYLKEFIVLAEKCNYSDAADLLFISQSSLSKHIKSIEHELDIVLFNKIGNRITLSEEGSIFLKYANSSVDQESAFKREIAYHRKKSNTVINVGSEYRIVDLLIAFRMQNSQYIVRQLDNIPHKTHAVDLLRSGKCELAFLVNFTDTTDKFVQIPILEDQDVAVLYNSHPLSRRKTVTFQDIKDENFIILGDQEDTSSSSISNGDFVRSRFLMNSASPNVVFNGMRGTEIVDYVRKEVGISILYKKTLYSMNLDNITMVDIVPPNKITVSLCYMKAAKLSSGARALIDFFSQAAQNGQIDEILMGTR
ncbi:MAG: LysR family transcriptional regulator [Ruminococcus sp.]|nr:LysR family transcriptional regulator [Ruminococcus sp.]